MIDKIRKNTMKHVGKILLTCWEKGSVVVDLSQIAKEAVEDDEVWSEDLNEVYETLKLAIRNYDLEIDTLAERPEMVVIFEKDKVLPA